MAQSGEALADTDTGAAWRQRRADVSMGSRFEGARSRDGLRGRDHRAVRTAPIDKEGKRREPEWFDEQRLEILETRALKLDNEANGAGPSPGPSRSMPR